MAEAVSQGQENSMLHYIVTTGKKLFAGRRPELVALSGVPKSTVDKIMDGSRKDPRHATVDALHRAIRNEEAKQAKGKKEKPTAVPRKAQP